MFWYFRIIYNISKLALTHNIVFIFYFQTLIKEVEEKEVGSHESVRGASRCTVVCDVDFSLDFSFNV